MKLSPSANMLLTLHCGFVSTVNQKHPWSRLSSGAPTSPTALLSTHYQAVLKGSASALWALRGTCSQLAMGTGLCELQLPQALSQHVPYAKSQDALQSCCWKNVILYHYHSFRLGEVEGDPLIRITLNKTPQNYPIIFSEKINSWFRKPISVCVLLQAEQQQCLPESKIPLSFTVK